MFYTLTVTRPNGTTYPVITNSGRTAEYTLSETIDYIRKFRAMDANRGYSISMAPYYAE